MAILTTLLTLLTPVWLPMLVAGAYSFGIRGCIPQRMLPKTDTVYWCVYVGGCLLAVGLFVAEIFGWQMALLYRWLWFIGLSIPMLLAMAVVLFLTIMSTDSW